VTKEELCFNARAIWALEKQVAKPVYHERTFWRHINYCPACQEQLRAEALKYCDNCGQKLDWSNYWEALKV
jgi:predicted amidophosphoribosyltransferase